MTIKTGRGDDYITHILDTAKCSRCGLCAKVCQGDVLHFKNGVITISHGKTFGCIGCAHCAAVCPHGCIRLTGRTLGDKSLEKFPSIEKPSFDSLYALALSRLNLLRRFWHLRPPLRCRFLRRMLSCWYCGARIR